jgi:hypothetical protein
LESITSIISKMQFRWTLEALSPTTVIRNVEQKNPLNSGSGCIRKADMILLAVPLYIWP